MIANFHIHYVVKNGEQLAIRWKQGKGKEKIQYCQSYDGANWITALEIANETPLHYQYILTTGEKETPEHGTYRQLTFPPGSEQAFCQDYWRPGNQIERLYLSAAFKDVIFKRKKAAAKPRKSKKSPKADPKNKVVFQLYAAAIPPDLSFCLLGSSEALGQWQVPLLLSDEHYPLWQTEIDCPEQTLHLSYKFAICDPATNQILAWEEGPNRELHFNFPEAAGCTLVRTDENFRQSSHRWRGAGVAVPVFSLRSQQGMGIGEFADLKALTDWSVKTRMKMIQVLPVNDTIATKTWTDSYPYAAISVYALHPLYIHLPAIARLRDKKAEARMQQTTERLNQLETVDFEQVLQAKFEFLQLLYQQEREAFFKDPLAQEFIRSNADWLKPYAAFCHLRDEYGTVQFPQWKKYSEFSQKVIEDLCEPGCPSYEAVAFHYFVQYHAHRQLLEASDYAKAQGVVLKGDLPIGIYRYSCDAWVSPHLYNMSGQAGAPPDPYADDGQNWGFPTYNWEEMSKDGFEWWRQRMTKLSEYFHALRIDHILGFFRIWEIPIHQISGILGLFNPRLPYSREELQQAGLFGDLDRYTQPYIRLHMLEEMFGPSAEFVINTFLEETGPGVFKLKEKASDQVKIRGLFAKLPKYKDLEKQVMKLAGEVLLIEEPGSGGKFFNPRITLNTTRSYRDLSTYEREVFDKLYNTYYYGRHDEFWRQQALWKLPALLQATNMLICGEDLGMIPASVPGVMQDLNIVSLEIQRMPKGLEEFGNPARYPYASVCSPSCHDMPTIRGWWEADAERSRRFFRLFFDAGKPAPAECSPSIVEAINRQHLVSPSMWAVFPIQDLVGMDAGLRRADAAAEQINDPSISQHYWRFRFHLELEQLLEAEVLNEHVKGMVLAAGR